MRLEEAGYHVLGPIARGGLAEVVLAERIGRGGVRQRVALKRMLPSLAAEPEFVSMLELEARAAAELEHPNIVSVFELVRCDGGLFLAMELVRGWTLGTVLDACAKRDERVPPHLAVHLVREICVALAHAHAKTDARGAPLGIIHRDVGPSNVLLSTDGIVKLGDFGLARAAAVARSTPGVWLRGKVPYVSPEQLAGAPLDARSDLYSAGILLFETLTCRPLFSADETWAASERAAQLPRLAQLAPDAERVQPLLDRALAHEREQRFASAREMADALAAAARALGPPVSAAQLAAWLAELGLPPPVSDESFEEQAPTSLVSLGRLPGAERPPPSSRASPAKEGPAPSHSTRPAAQAQARVGDALRSLLVLAVLGVAAFFLAMHAARSLSAPDPRPGTRLEIRTTPEGASVWIDGVARGKTPTVVRGLPAGAHVVLVQAPSGATRSLDVDLGEFPDQTLDIGVP